MPKHLVHIHSVQTADGQPKIPDPSIMKYGELAINYAKGYETISIKNNSDEIVQFKSDEYYQNQLNSKFKKIDVSSLFSGAVPSITSEISSEIAAIGNDGVSEFPVLYAGPSIGNIKPTWIRTVSGITNMMCLADNKIYYFEISGTTVQRAELAIS